MVKKVASKNKKGMKAIKPIYPNWWLRKTRSEQEDYLRSHPKSRFKVTRRKPRVKKDAPVDRNKPADTGSSVVSIDTTAAIDDTPIQEKVDPAVSKYIDNNAEDIAKSVDSVLTDTERDVSDRVEQMSPKDKATLGKLIKRAATSEKSEDAIRAAAVTLAKLGLVTVGIAAAASIGVPVAFSLLMLYSNKPTVSDTFDKLPVDRVITNFVGGVFNKAREGSKDKGRLRKAVVDREPDVISDEEADSEKASVTVSNTTDLIKTFLHMRRKDWKTEVASVRTRKTGVKWVRAINHARLLYRIERACQDLTLLRSKFLVASEIGYASRADKFILELSSLHNNIRSELSAAASLLIDNVGNDLRNAAMAVRQRLGVNGALKPTMLLHNSRTIPAYYFTAGTATASFEVYVSKDGPNLLLNVSRVPFSTPIAMDSYDTRTRSLSTVLKECGIL